MLIDYHYVLGDRLKL